MLTRYILLLRRASRPMQQRHAFFWALSVTAIIGVIWGLSLPKLLKPLPEGGVLAEAEEHARPLGSLWGQAREQFASIMESFSDANTTEYETGVGPAFEAATATPGITLSPEDIEKAQARANIVYRPGSTTSTATTIATSTTGAPRVVQIATTSRTTLAPRP